MVLESGGGDGGESCFPAQHTGFHFTAQEQDLLFLAKVRTKACQILAFVKVGTTKPKWTQSSSFLTDRQGQFISFQSQDLEGAAFLKVFSLNVHVPPRKTDYIALGINC